ncbi:uncharacterized protein LOC119140709 [Falco rusticolus]|uniref:uncharacterized protein LOC119140709 n=1 Tax=Falco rusticolus TaxID=120794 RepID=UPI001886621C|nr:uncharacterized protein LOC119140709 [Falco rusticolus]
MNWLKSSINKVICVCQRAREAHSIFHQNAKGLARAYKLSMEEARAIVKACPICSHHNSGLVLGCGVNPRGLKSNDVWQMDVTHVPAFGRLKYVHVTIDTYSHMLWATPQPGEKVRDVRRHLTSCFAVLGVPITIKTDNGPAYGSGLLKRFMQMWNIKHVTAIPHSPTGQAIVERANGTLKRYIEKFKEIQDVKERESREPYMQFIDRLKQALERQVDNAEARDILLTKLAVENANVDCKRLLKSLPNPNPTLVEMVEACNRIGMVDHKFEAMASAFATMRGVGNCYGCGVIDSDSVDEIKIMAWTPFPPCTIPQGSRIVQLIFIPARRPMYQCTLIYNDQQIALNGIIDTGADVTVISQAK